MYKLREIDKKDLRVINKWRNDQELIKYLGAPYRFINIGVDERWFDNYMSSRNNTVRCAVVEENNDEILGLITLTAVDYLNQSAELHIMIGGIQNRNKGIGTFAVREMLKHAFNNLNMHRVELTVLETNARAIHLYEKIGFVHEGTKRDSNYKNGKFVNMRLYSILKEEFNLNGQEVPRL